MFQWRMAWIIIDVNGEPLTDIEGKLILVDSEAAAREWLMHDDQRVERFDAEREVPHDLGLERGRC